MTTPNASTARERALIGDRTMARNMVPRAHRVHMADGRILTGDIHRPPKSRLVEHLATIRQFLSLTNAMIEGESTPIPYIAVNIHHVISIEEADSDGTLPWLDD